MSSTLLFTSLVQWLMLLFAISLHEASHAGAAGLLGDQTARLLGRASLNPLRHFDVVGSALLPAVLIAAGGPLFGWGKPAPLLAKNLRRPGRDEVLVAAAGPAANLALAFAATVALVVAVRALGPEARDAARLTLQGRLEEAAGLAGFPVAFALVQATVVNLLLGLVNLLPLPPFDGARIVWHLLPPDWAERLFAWRSRLVVIIGAAFVGVFGLLFLFVAFAIAWATLYMLVT